MQTMSQNPPLQFKPDIDKLIWKLYAEVHKEREKEMAVNQAYTLIDYLTHTFREAKTI